jgi:membrane fusion protein, copper/silver efflux system
MRSGFFLFLIISIVCFSCKQNNKQLQADLARPGKGRAEGIKTIQPVKKEVQMIIPVDGVISYNPSQFENVSSRYMGRIEKLFVKYKNQSVTKGEKLFDIYCPDMMTGQNDLLYLLKNDPGNAELIHQARQKLILLGLTDPQIKKIEQSGQPNYTLAVYSPVSGFTIDNENTRGSRMNQRNPAGLPASSSMGVSGATGMVPAASPAQPAPTGSELQLREGMYVQQGQTLFRIVKGAHLWGIFNVNPEMSAFVAVAQSVDAGSEEGVYKGIIDFIEPVIRQGDKTMTVRVLIDNRDGHFKVGQLVHARVYGKNVTGLWIPRSAVIDLGNKSIVLVKLKDTVEPRRVITGITYENNVLVYSGLTEQDQVVEEVQYLYDSDTFIKSGITNVK